MVFVELTKLEGSKILVAVDSIRQIAPGFDDRTIITFKDNGIPIEVYEKYEEMKNLLLCIIPGAVLAKVKPNTGEPTIMEFKKT